MQQAAAPTPTQTGTGTSSTTTTDTIQRSFVSLLSDSLKRQIQHWLDKSTPFLFWRWLMLFGLLALYVVRVYVLRGFFIITYALGIYLLNQFIGFLSPIEDSETEKPILPQNVDPEDKPFERRVPEFKFWFSFMKAIVVSVVATFFPFLDIPVYWPILLIYFVILFFLSMKARIEHMIKYKYCPCDFRKRKAGRHLGSASGVASIPQSKGN